MTNTTTKPQLAKKSYAPGTSRRRRSDPTVLLQMAQALEQQKEVAQRLRELRGLIPQPRIADQAGVTLRAYQAWEAGGGIKWDNIQRLAEIFEVSDKWLLHGDGVVARGATPDLAAVSQLDRIESKLDAMLTALNVTWTEPDPGEALEQELEAGEPPDERRDDDTEEDEPDQPEEDQGS